MLRLIGGELAPEVERAAARLAVFYAGGLMAIEEEVLSVREKSLWSAIRKVIENWVDVAVQLPDEERALKNLRVHIIQHQARYPRSDSDSDFLPPTIEGYRDDDYFYVLPHILDKFGKSKNLAKNIQGRSDVSNRDQKPMLLTEKDRLQWRLTVNKSRMMVYAIHRDFICNDSRLPDEEDESNCASLKLAPSAA